MCLAEYLRVWGGGGLDANGGVSGRNSRRTDLVRDFLQQSLAFGTNVGQLSMKRYVTRPTSNALPLNQKGVRATTKEDTLLPK